MSRNEALFKDPCIEYPSIGNFSDYINACKKLIEKTRVDLAHDKEKIVSANVPFEFKPRNETKTGILMLHGLLDSGYQMREISQHFADQGYLVRGMLLPGHGTVPGALLNIEYETWVKAVEEAIQSFKNEVDNIILVGNSTGASLALYHALKYPKDIKSLILLSPPLKIYSSLAPLSNWYKPFSKKIQRAAWFHQEIEETIDYAKYLSLPYNAIYQVYRLSLAVREMWLASKTKCPLFFIAAEKDRIVSAEEILKYFEEDKDTHHQLLWYGNPKVSDERIMIRPNAYPELHIESISHVCIPYSLNNPHYGIEGDFKYRSQLDPAQNIFYGEYLRDTLFKNKCEYKLGITKNRLERLTSHPDFEFMMSKMVEWVQHS